MVLAHIILIGHEVDAFGIGTYLVPCYAQATLGCVFKLVEINNQPHIKLSEDVSKVSIPCKKRSFRLYGKEGYALLDTNMLIPAVVHLGVLLRWFSPDMPTKGASEITMVTKEKKTCIHSPTVEKFVYTRWKTSRWEWMQVSGTEFGLPYLEFMSSTLAKKKETKLRTQGRKKYEKLRRQCRKLVGESSNNGESQSDSLTQGMKSAESEEATDLEEAKAQEAMKLQKLDEAKAQEAQKKLDE
ncbi:unnamed protein product [Lactuca virosa]|uniref:nicotinate phosphoribosyltransferase n=1 Tax=Lactuca virosa TaxID=75947 RepID=A0AAU9N7E5_9ASTR|nr:unnamed protein product [Lactuca virosa]